MKFKEGDKVTVINGPHTGEKGVVFQTNRNSVYSYAVYFNNTQTIWCPYLEKELKLTTGQLFLFEM